MNDPEDDRHDDATSIQIIAGEEDLKGRYAGGLDLTSPG